MIDFQYLSSIRKQTASKIVMIVVDGLGGMTNPSTGQSELEAAVLPNLDRLAASSSCGVSTPVLPGITPGSGPGHMALFGYNPIKYLLGRGVLEGLGIGAPIGKGDVAARGNFCLLGDDGKILDRRAGRITTEECVELVELLKQIEIPGFGIEIYPVMDYRFVLVLKGEPSSPNVSETDPQITGIAPLVSNPTSEGGTGTALAVNLFTQRSMEILREHKKSANGILLRGFSNIPELPHFGSSYALNPAAIAAYPMYRGVAGLLGMEVLNSKQTFEDEIKTLEMNFSKGYDYFFLHYKPADSAGEDGNFSQKVAMLEEFDKKLERVVQLEPDVIVICGDHSTPSYFSSHSWHPVPFLINSKLSQGKVGSQFTENSCREGTIGRILAEELMLLVLSHAGKLNKFGP